MDYSHFQIVFEEGGSQSELEVQAPLGQFANEAPEFGYAAQRNHANPDFTPYYNDPQNYTITSIGIGDRDGEKIWELLEKIHAQFQLDSPNYTYGFTQNSKSYAATLLWLVGIDISQDAAGARPNAAVDGFVGGDLNLLTDGYRITNIPP